ncbi:hypothetical protein BROUX41_001970 [Berkeleyomyces rouxiae]|uniref:uncharacterized protein n=1 Tax=Berkeleyomyces rouxiae TaxID=2035830 RepID=UPI003B7812C0
MTKMSNVTLGPQELSKLPAEVAEYLASGDHTVPAAVATAIRATASPPDRYTDAQRAADIQTISEFTHDVFRQLLSQAKASESSLAAEREQERAAMADERRQFAVLQEKLNGLTLMCQDAVDRATGSEDRGAPADIIDSSVPGPGRFHGTADDPDDICGQYRLWRDLVQLKFMDERSVYTSEAKKIRLALRLLAGDAGVLTENIKAAMIKNPNDPQKWKHQTFKSLIEYLDSVYDRNSSVARDANELSRLSMKAVADFPYFVIRLETLSASLKLDNITKALVLRARLPQDMVTASFSMQARLSDYQGWLSGLTNIYNNLSEIDADNAFRSIVNGDPPAPQRQRKPRRRQGNNGQ